MKRGTLGPSWAKPAKTEKPDPITAETRALVRQRSGGQCELGCGSPATALHHRLLRRHGDHRPANLLALCAFDHRRIHGHPEESYASGWLIRSSSGDDPAKVPVVVVGRLVLLTVDGKYRELPAGKSAAREAS